MLPFLNVEMNAGVKSTPVQGGELKMSDPSPEWQFRLLDGFWWRFEGLFSTAGMELTKLESFRGNFSQRKSFKRRRYSRGYRLFSARRPYILATPQGSKRSSRAQMVGA